MERLFIDGSFVDAASGETFTTTAPRDGSVLAEVASGHGEDVDLAVRAARRAFDDGRWRLQPPAARKRVLLKLADLMRANSEELARVESMDTGKPIGEASRVDVAKAADTFTWYAEAIDKVYGEIAPTGPDALALVSREPLGVVGAVVPWNYPLMITSWKLAPALAAGNSVVLKPAEQSPLSALVLARLAAEAGLPDGVLNVVTGFGETAGRALGLHPSVDKIAFTGSAPVGRAFLGYAAASNGKQISIEAGGKSPQLVLADLSDVDKAAESIAWGFCYNAGQTCNAGSRLVVHSSIAAELVDAVRKVLSGFTVGDPLDPATTLGPVIDATQLATVLGYLDVGQEEATAVHGGRRLHEETGGWYVEPAVLEGVANTATVAQEEIFGPVLVTTTFDDLEEGIRIANETRFGLAASVWTADFRTAHQVAARLRAGTVWVNTFDASDVITPFGGFGETGGGRDKSLHALDGYTGLKTTWFDLS